VKAKGKDWFQHSESFTGNLDLAFKLWDAVSISVSSAFDRAMANYENRCMQARRMRAGSSRKLSSGMTQTNGCLKDDDMDNF
jgi:hypothetical protein